MVQRGLVRFVTTTLKLYLSKSNLEKIDALNEVKQENNTTGEIQRLHTQDNKEFIFLRAKFILSTQK